MINSVVCVLWYEHIVRDEVNHAKSIISNTFSGEMRDLKLRLMTSEVEELVKIKSMVGDKCLQLYVSYNGNTIKAGRMNDSFGTEMSVEGVETGDEMVVKKIPMPGSFLGMGPKLTFLVIPIQGYGREKASAGVLLNTGEIFHYIIGKQPVILLYIFLNSVVLATIGFFRMRKGVLKPVEELVDIADNYQLAEGAFFLIIKKMSLDSFQGR